VRRGSALANESLRARRGQCADALPLSLAIRASRIAAGEVAGALASIAMQLRIAPETARTHLNMIFRKLEVNRQADVIGLLSALGRASD
jgi:DNA-binding CsgD family transcriptional regulator